MDRAAKLALIVGRIPAGPARDLLIAEVDRLRPRLWLSPPAAERARQSDGATGHEGDVDAPAWIGGLPVLPAEQPWPQPHDQDPLPYVLGMRLAALPPGFGLPTTGTLNLFASDMDAAVVMVSADAVADERDHEDADEYDRLDLDVFPALHPDLPLIAPDEERSPADKALLKACRGFRPEDIVACIGARGGTFQRDVYLLSLGWSLPIQATRFQLDRAITSAIDPAARAQLIQQRDDLVKDLPDPDEKAQSRWRQFMTISSRREFYWNDGGDLQIWIDEDDLAHGDFSRIQSWIDSG
jgi:hypothetical protein